MDYKLLMFEGIRGRFRQERRKESASPLSPEEISGRGSSRFTINLGIAAGAFAFLGLLTGQAILAPETLSIPPSQFLPLSVFADLAISTAIGSLVATMAVVGKRVSSAFDYLYKNEPNSKRDLDKYPTLLNI